MRALHRQRKGDTSYINIIGKGLRGGPVPLEMAKTIRQAIADRTQQTTKRKHYETLGAAIWATLRRRHTRLCGMAAASGNKHRRNHVPGLGPEAGKCSR